MDVLRIEHRASRVLSGRDTATPFALDSVCLMVVIRLKVPPFHLCSCGLLCLWVACLGLPRGTLVFLWLSQGMAIHQDALLLSVPCMAMGPAHMHFFPHVDSLLCLCWLVCVVLFCLVLSAVLLFSVLRGVVWELSLLSLCCLLFSMCFRPQSLMGPHYHLRFFSFGHSLFEITPPNFIRRDRVQTPCRHGRDSLETPQRLRRHSVETPVETPSRLRQLRLPWS